MKAAAGHDLDDDALRLAEAIHRETDGNPFFVTELLRHLAESEVIVQDADGRWTLAGPLELAALPDTVLMVIGARVGRLGPQAERVLSLAAVIGRDFDLDVVATAAATSEDELLDILDAASGCGAGAGNGRRAGALQLLARTHPTNPVRGPGPDASGQSAPPSCRSDRASRCRSSRGAGAQNLPTTGSTLRKGPTFRRRWSTPAGLPMRRWARSLPAEALRYYVQAQDLYSQAGIDDPLLSLDLAIGVGITQRQTGDHASRQTLIDAAQTGSTTRRHGPHDRGGTRESSGLSLGVRRRLTPTKVALLEMALDRVAADHPDRPLLLATLCTELTFVGSFDDRKRLADEAVDARTGVSGPRRARAGAQLRALSAPRAGTARLVIGTVGRGATARRALGDPVQLFWAAHERSHIAAWACDIEEMDRCGVIRERALTASSSRCSTTCAAT